ncbi:hypothetical protein BDA99DRAFT_290330 [Phascolomyces articulosus]|uniref:Uncharacterized protein n=1 Tax=Phascolomyces articulosus TaxID=60185 RepID=A0AAD5JLX2_9FUNG|nr:hypothetical protein BDA99DRAFT_290330 [Phascolomyces articulosus]
MIDNNSTPIGINMDEETLTTDNDGDDSESVETERDGKKRKNTKLDLKKFKEEYDKMIDENKWTLSCSGRKVEDVLYILCHSFVVDPWDTTYLTKSVFTKAEIDEIKTWKQKGYPVPEEKCLQYLNQYKQIKNATEARRMIFKAQGWDEDFDRNTNHDLDWIRHSYYTMIRELERGGVDDHTNSETWLLSHIWTSVDRVFDDMELYVLRGENASAASSSRKNKERVPQGEEKLERKRMGRRLDMILRKKKLELGGGEAGKEMDDNDAKLLRERDIKLPKALKDMMMMLKKEKGDIEGVRIAGLLQYGLKMTSITLDVPEKYAHRITRTQNVLVPYTFEDLPNFRKVLYMALSNKAIVLDTLHLLSTPAQDEEVGYDDLSGVMEPPEEDSYQLPDTFSSQ